MFGTFENAQYILYWLSIKYKQMINMIKVSIANTYYPRLVDTALPTRLVIPTFNCVLNK